MTRYELRVELNRWMCGCGSPESAVRFVYDVLSAIRTRWDDSKPLSLFRPQDRPALDRVWAEQAAAMKALLPTDGIEYFVLYILNDWDLLEHGVSVGGSWLTEKGKAMLAALDREVGDEFHTLCESSCVHGYSTDDANHDCLAYDEAPSVPAVATPHETATPDPSRIEVTRGSDTETKTTKQTL
jgi:hypothetical protein